jgi:hypothetical protein
MNEITIEGSFLKQVQEKAAGPNGKASKRK